MNLEELKKTSITDINAFIELNAKKSPVDMLPKEIIHSILAIIKSIQPKSIIHLNSNYGEVIKSLLEIDNVIGIENDYDKFEISNYLKPITLTINENPTQIEFDDKFDVVISDHKRIRYSAKKEIQQELEIINGLEKSMSLLKKTGYVIKLIPHQYLYNRESALFPVSRVGSRLRKIILDKYGLKSIISFGRKGGISIIVLTKTPQKETSFYKGNTNGNFLSNLETNAPDFKVPIGELYDIWEYDFNSPEIKTYEGELSKFETKSLDELVDLVNGGPSLGVDIKPVNEGVFKRLLTNNIRNGYYEEIENNFFPQKSIEELKNVFPTWQDVYGEHDIEKAILKAGDVVVSKFIFEGKTSFYIHEESNGLIIAESDMMILRGKNTSYIATYLATDSGKRLISKQLKRYGSKVANVQFVYPAEFQKIKIPILPLDSLDYASGKVLGALPITELLSIKEKYDALEAEYKRLKETPAPHQEQLNQMQKTLNSVLAGQVKISQNIEAIKSSLNDLVNEFDTIKSLPRDLDEKINRLHESIDNKLSSLLKDDIKIDSYIKEIKRWFNDFDFLELKSQTYLPQAEFIYDQISQLESPDYSPFILQYCRALENELLQKIFRAYVQFLIDREIILEDIFSWDFELKESGKPNNANTFRLIRHLKKCLNKTAEFWFFELGSMEVNLRYLTGKSVEKSPLLQDLKEFVLSRFETELLSIEYLDEMKTIIVDFRNQSAHPNLIGTEEAIDFHKKIKQCLILLMDNYKTVHNKT